MKNFWTAIKPCNLQTIILQMETNDENLRKLTGKQNLEENFKMPDGYFDSFSSRVKEKIDARQAVTQKTYWYHWLLKPAVGFSLASVVLIVGGYFVFFSPEKDLTTTASNQPNATEIVDTAFAKSAEEYLTQEISWQELEDLAEDDLIAVSFEDEPVVKQPQKGSIESLTENDKNEIEEYLLENADEILYENL